MISLPVLAISCWFWLNKFWIDEMGAELPAMTSHHRHICNPHCVRKTHFEMKELYLLVLSVEALCNSNPSLNESIFSFRLSGLCLFTWHAQRFAVNNLLSPPIAVLHHGKMARSGERSSTQQHNQSCGWLHLHLKVVSDLSTLCVTQTTNELRLFTGNNVDNEWLLNSSIFLSPHPTPPPHTSPHQTTLIVYKHDCY